MRILPAIALIMAMSVPGTVMPCEAFAERTGRAAAKFDPEGKCLVVIGAAWDDEIRAYTRLTGDVPAGSKFFHQFDWGTDFFRHCVRKSAPPRRRGCRRHQPAQADPWQLQALPPGRVRREDP